MPGRARAPAAAGRGSWGHARRMVQQLLRIWFDVAGPGATWRVWSGVAGGSLGDAAHSVKCVVLLSHAQDFGKC